MYEAGFCAVEKGVGDDAFAISVCPEIYRACWDYTNQIRA
jgi:hypothetical protein